VAVERGSGNRTHHGFFQRNRLMRPVFYRDSGFADQVGQPTAPYPSARKIR